MADIALTTGKIAPVIPQKAKIFSYIAAVALVAGDVVYITSAGKVDKASAGAAGTAKFRGIALEAVGAGQAVDVLFEGHVYGYTVSGLAYDAVLYLSNTAGALSDAAGTTSVIAGKIVPLTDKDLTKVVYFTGMAG